MSPQKPRALIGHTKALALALEDFCIPRTSPNNGKTHALGVGTQIYFVRDISTRATLTVVEKCRIRSQGRNLEAIYICPSFSDIANLLA